MTALLDYGPLWAAVAFIAMVAIVCWSARAELEYRDYFARMRAEAHEELARHEGSRR